MSDEMVWRDVAGTADDPNALRGRRVLVMGLGLLGGGVAAARYAAKMGAAEVVVTDLRSAETLAESIAKLNGLPIRYVLGRHEMDDFTRAEVVVRNPGVRRGSPYLEAARVAGARIEMEIAWFFRACPGKIAGVTGTRGKSTTTTLLHAILTEAGLRPLLGGNLGGIETLSLLPEITPDRWVVLELGNWMLEGLHTVRRSPHLAIFINLLPDHLDAYDSMEDYGEAKSAIFRYQGMGDIAIFNADNDYARRYGDEAPGSHVWFFSAERGAAWPRAYPDHARPFAYADAIRLRGAHNLSNIQAATLAAELIGVEGETIRRAVTNFGGVPHRLEVVRELDGVTWVNDSASTAPVAGVAALRSFDQPVVLIRDQDNHVFALQDRCAHRFAPLSAGKVAAGRVTCGGKTVALGTVVAMAADGSVHTATIDPEGRYTIAKVPAGTVRLGVISRDPVKVQLKQTKLAAKSDRLTEADRGIPSFANGWFAIPAKYEDPLGSGLELAIKGPQVFNIQLP
jgi:UDP-N-acetylmuramoylalanine--D-glutamate ligase